jgi:dTDP-4-amino-4,6-dideoxygalactose transaminase
MDEKEMDMTVRAIPFGKPILGREELLAVQEVLDSGLLVHGPKSKQFEADFARFTGAAHAVSVSSCTAGLHLTYFLMGLGPGDEVIVPAMTHTATAHAVELTGARPVFVDAETRTGNLDLDQVEAAITGRTRAISVVHFLGMPVDMDRLGRLAGQRNLPVIEDCALAVGASIRGTHAGRFGLAGCFSFYPVKHMTTAEGGVVLTGDAGLAEKLTRQRAFGVDRHQGERVLPGQYDVVSLGFNYRMSEIHAALGIEQLKRLPGFLERRRANFERLAAGLSAVPEIELLESRRDGYQSSYYCLSIILSEPLARRRTDFIQELKSRGVGTSIYYPRPVPLMTYYRARYGYQDGQFPGAARISDRSIALPVGPHLDPEDMDYITSHIKEAIWKITHHASI